MLYRAVEVKLVVSSECYIGADTEAKTIGEIMEPDPLAVRLTEREPKAPLDLIERHHAELHRYALTMLRNRVMALRAWLYRISLDMVCNSLRSRTHEVTNAPSMTGFEAARLKVREARA